MNIRRWGVASLLVIALSTSSVELWAIEISVGAGKRRIETYTYLDQELLSLNDLAGVFSLRLRENRSSLTIVGERGEVLITDGRPLVRSGDHYVLLTAGVWKRREGEWYVPQDFLLRALSNIVSQKIEKQADGSFQVKRLKTNRVRVGMESYPDHLSVIFEVSENAPVQVREFRDYIEVVFSDFLVRPEQVASSPDARLVTSVEFNEQESFGSFRIQKGSQFSSFRQHYLESPPKLVVEMLGNSSSMLALSASADPLLGQQPGDLKSGGDRIPRAAGISDVVVIDPGHGGVDYGVDAYQDLSEKVITMNVARRIQEELSRRSVNVRLTRARDVQLPNEHRSAVSNFYKCRLYVGIHLGGAPSSEARGPVVYVYSPPTNATSGLRLESGQGEPLFIPWEKGQSEFLSSSRRLATSLQSELNRLFESKNSVVAARLAVLAPVRAPAVVIETGFLTNEEDQQLLAASGFQERVADSISNVIIRFLK